MAATTLTRPYYGVLLGPTLVLAAYGGTHVSPDHLYRPLITSAAVAVIAFAVIGVASRRWHAAAFVVALSLLAVIGVWALFWPLLAAWLFVAWRSTRLHVRSWAVAPEFTQPLNVLVSAWFGIALATAVLVSLPGDLPSRGESVAVSAESNIYMILLDGYPRADTLLEYFGFDNRPFLSELEARGFEVAEDSRTDYVGTIQVVPTMLHMRPLEDLLGGAWDGSDAQHRRLWHLLNHAPAHDAFEAAGYTTHSILSSAEALDWRTADVVLESLWLTRFEDHLLQNGVLHTIVPFDASDRAEVLDAFTNLEASAGTSARFVFAHIMSPHNPYVFAVDGTPAEPCGHECTNHAGPPNPMLGDRLIGQIQYLNTLVLDAVDHIAAVDPEAIVIVFSDHGLRRDRADMDEWHRTLFAARGGPGFPDRVTPMAIFPSLLSQTDGRGD